MCEPISIGIATAAASYMGQKQAADAQEAAQAAASKAEQERAGKANTGVRVQEAQEGIARSQRKEATQIKGMENKARARLIALTESGAAGRSLDTVMQNLDQEEARYNFSEQRQKGLQDQSRFFGFEESAMRTRMNQLRINQPIKQASLLESGLKGVQAGLSTAQAVQGLKGSEQE